MATRALGAIGRFFITTGIVILLFVGYQLWGTGLQEASAQNALDDDFEALLGAIETPIETTTTVAAPSSTAPPETTTTTTVPAAGGTIPVEDAELAERLFVSVRTMEKHVSSLLAKLHVSSRRDLARLAKDRGWTTHTR